MAAMCSARTSDGAVAFNLIAIEEHFWTPQLRELRRSEIFRSDTHVKRLDDLGALRLREIDEAGIDMQVLSETAPAARARAGARHPPGPLLQRLFARRMTQAE